MSKPVPTRSFGNDRILLFTVILLTVFGLLMLYSASSLKSSDRYGISSFYFLRQLGCALLGLALMFALTNVDYHLWRRRKILVLLLLLSVLGLALVLTQPSINGARRWFRLGALPSFQPSEAAKLVLLIFLAAFLERYDREINDPARRLLPCTAVVALVAALVAVEPDLGQTVVIGVIAGTMLLVAGLSWKYVLAAAAPAAALFYFEVYRVPFRWQRVLAYADPTADPQGAGWQVLQSLTAIGSGGLFGQGPGAGRSKLFYLPEAHGDFIFAVIGEELGLVGAGLTCVAFAVIMFRGMRIALRAPDKFGCYLALGITVQVVLQALINFSSVLSLLPAKGTALPFISQGGSSLLMNLAASGILLNISEYGDSA